MKSTQEFLNYVLGAHTKDGKTDSYLRAVDKLFSLGLKEEILSKRLVNEAVDRMDIDTTDWDLVSSKTLLLELYRKASLLRNYKESDKYGSFSDLINILVGKGLYSSFLIEKYTNEELNEIGSYLVKERDELLTYSGTAILSERYLAQDHFGVVHELPQERFLVIAMTIMQDENPEDRLAYIKEAYWALSNLYMTVATPTLSNSGKTHGQLSSCFIDVMEDSLDGIYATTWDAAKVSKNGGGVGQYLGQVRGLGGSIRGFKNKASGITPWAKLLNTTAVSVDQLGQRKGAFALYLDAWHKDIIGFLELGLSNGDERNRAYDVFTGICIPDYFMELIEADEDGRMLTPNADWHLFDPHEVKETMGWCLEDSFDEKKGSGEWRTKYQQCIDHPLLSRTTIKVKDLVLALLTAQLENGHPYMFYRDEVNRKNPNKHAGMIYCSNLCTEIAQNMSATEIADEYVDEEGYIVQRRKAGDYVVCNLASVNLGRAYKDNVVERVIKIAIRMLDNVISVNNLPLLQATIANSKYRAIGLGTFGWHHLLANEHIKWDSERSIERADEVYEEVAYHAIKASADLAQEKGSYPVFEGSDFNTGEYFEQREYETNDRFDWDSLKEQVKGGIRNGYLMAVAPNVATAVIAGSTQGIDPFFGSEGIYYEEKKDSKLATLAPDLSSDTYPYYYKQNAHYVDQTVSIKQNAKRQRHIDQAISFNVYVPNDIKGKDLMQLHRKAWKNDLKTTYYTKSTANLVDNSCDTCQ